MDEQHDDLTIAYMAGLHRGKELARAEQEPFRFTDKENWLSGNGRMWSEMHREDGDFPIYTTPPQRAWQGLTDEEIKGIIGPWGPTPIKGYTRDLFDKIEAKLKEKNA